MVFGAYTNFHFNFFVNRGEEYKNKIVVHMVYFIHMGKKILSVHTTITSMLNMLPSQFKVVPTLCTLDLCNHG
jgi:hypothetical protein